MLGTGSYVWIFGASTMEDRLPASARIAVARVTL